MGFDCGVNAQKLNRINNLFLPVKDKFSENGMFDPYVLSTKTDALIYQIPGGMLSNLVAQLKAQNAIDRLDEVLDETPREMCIRDRSDILPIDRSARSWP